MVALKSKFLEILIVRNLTGQSYLTCIFVFYFDVVNIYYWYKSEWCTCCQYVAYSVMEGGETAVIILST